MPTATSISAAMSRCAASPIIKGDELVEPLHGARSIATSPLHVSIVGGEPLVRYRELGTDPAAAGRAGHSHAAGDQRGAPDPGGVGRRCSRLQIVVSIDGLQPEHDVRRTPATYDRILKHIVGHQITVHCTVTRQQVRARAISRNSCGIWQANPTHAADLGQPVHAADGRDLDRAADARPTARASSPTCAGCAALSRSSRCWTACSNVYAKPPKSPDDCIFAQTTECYSSDLEQPHHAVPVRRQSGLLQLRLHRVGRTRSDRPSPTEGRHPRRPDLLCVGACRPGGREAAQSGRSADPVKKSRL